jgi:hypothetical protein
MKIHVILMAFSDLHKGEGSKDWLGAYCAINTTSDYHIIILFSIQKPLQCFYSSHFPRRDKGTEKFSDMTLVI